MNFFKLLVCFLMAFQGSTFAQTVIYFQNENPETSALIEIKYYSLGEPAPAGSWFYLKGNVILSPNSQILVYSNTPNTSTVPNFFNSANQQITLFELSPGEYKTRIGSGAPFNYFGIWTGDGTWDCILVSSSSTETCQFSPSASETINSLRPNAFALRNAFNLQSAKIAQGLKYDCTIYDQNNLCVSFAGTRSDGKYFDATNGALIVAHQPSKQFRWGAYVDQSMGSSASGGLTIKNGKSGYGAFAVWSESTDGSGVRVRTAANVGNVDMKSTREAFETSEAGFGRSNIESSGVQLEISKGYAINSTWGARPYVGYRKTTNTRAAYAEQETVDVTAPLSYSSLKQNVETLSAGVTFAHTESAKTSMFLTAGVDHEAKNRFDRYQATSEEIEGIGSINLNEDKRKTYLAFSLAVNHDLDKTQRLGVTLNHRKQVSASGSVTSAMVQYSKGF